VYWPISVAFEFAPEEVNIDNLTDIEKNSDRNNSSERWSITIEILGLT